MAAVCVALLAWYLFIMYSLSPPPSPFCFRFRIDTTYTPASTTGRETRRYCTVQTNITITITPLSVFCCCLHGRANSNRYYPQNLQDRPTTFCTPVYLIFFGHQNTAILRSLSCPCIEWPSSPGRVCAGNTYWAERTVRLLSYCTHHA